MEEKGSDIKVHEIMTPNPETIDFTASIREAVYIMRDRKCRHLPVMNGSEVEGIISDRDLGSYLLPFDVEQSAEGNLRGRVSYVDVLRTIHDAF